MSTSTIPDNIDLAEDFEIREQVQADLLRRITEAPVDSRAALSDYVPTADEHQYKVIHADEQTVRLVAPAGSGKTQTVVNRVLNLVKQGMHPDRILVLTFDTSAAKALRDKMSEQTQAVGTSLRNFQVSTLNAFGYGILRQYFASEFKPIVSKNQTRSMMYFMRRDLADAGRDKAELLPNNLRDRVYFEFFSLLKNELIDPRNVDSQKFADFVCTSPHAEPFLLNALPLGIAAQSTQLTSAQVANLKTVIQILLWMYKSYDGKLRSLNVIDFDDQKLRAHLSLQVNHTLLKDVQSRFNEVIVDEFQDINRLDFSFIKSISERSRLIVVGDDDQAIYGFRGCSPEYIINLGNHLDRQHASYELRKNYRCPPNIVEHATRLIRFNRNRIDKNPVAHNDVAAHISVESTGTAGLEARSVVTYIMQVRSRNEKLGFEKFAVLYRTNAQSLPLQVEFILNDIPYWVREEDNVLENDSLTKFLAVLRVRLARREGQNPNSRDCAMLVGSYFRYITDLQLEKLDKLFQSNGDFDSVFRSEAFYQVLPKARSSRCREVVLGLFSLGGRATPIRAARERNPHTHGPESQLERDQVRVR